MSLPFTAQNLLTGFAWKMSDLLWLNEVGCHDPYKLWPPINGSKSGYAFGAVQWDIPNYVPFDSSLDRADDIFRNILLNAKDGNGQSIFDLTTVNAIININIDPVSGTRTTSGLAYTKGNDTILTPYITRINQALDSAYGRQKIDAEHVTYINAIVRWVNDTVTLTTNPADNTYLANSEVARLFIGDLRNQYSDRANLPLRSFLQGNQNVTIGNNTATVTKVGRLGMDDILNFTLPYPRTSALPTSSAASMASFLSPAATMRCRMTPPHGKKKPRASLASIKTTSRERKLRLAATSLRSTPASSNPPA